ncbi:membrane hypothetical protein [Rhodococcus sp. RD6.2]|uniref:VanZ family protein n=1 Tax=Rhodococcus sp. RD6.2 TaxID=260936 RepID=UPI00063B1B88|nr:VanZ family protein [Rhodococcus sp. RD6.2]CRK49627.1 membrane hypothetical protein [Rhodococcus sp. RD6.2]
MREQVVYSVLVGLAAAAVLALPLMVWQYRKYGRVSAARLTVVVAALIYAAAVVAFTMFPLPSLTPRWCDLYAVTEPVLRAFAFVSDIRRDTAGMSAVGVLTSPAVMQVVLNVALFVPFGVFGLVLFERSRAATIAAAVAVSGLIELTQYTGVWGVFPCAYRVADVNDLLLNSAGAVVGVVLAGLAPQLVPSRGLLAAGRPVPRPVTVWRRWVGMAVDVTAFVGVFVTAAVVVQAGAQVVGISVDAGAARAIAAVGDRGGRRARPDRVRCLAGAAGGVVAAAVADRADGRGQDRAGADRHRDGSGAGARGPARGSAVAVGRGGIGAVHQGKPRPVRRAQRCRHGRRPSAAGGGGADAAPSRSGSRGRLPRLGHVP